VTRTFANNDDVVFMDVNLSEEAIRESPNGDPYGPGVGGWPTIRYFNKETGIAGGAYKQKTDGAMCDELGDKAMMEAYVEDYGNASLCSLDGKGCDEREVGFIEKGRAMSADDQKAQLTRLEGMESKPMKPELLSWVKKRKKILKQLIAAEGRDEL
jgi:hypothetical protein